MRSKVKKDEVIKKVQPKISAAGAAKGRPDGGGKPCIPAGLPGERKQF